MSADEKTVKYAKLEWYREVLSLEPNSKLFLPLSRLLAELGSEESNAELMNEAFNVLRRGLDIHPDFMEARLFLIELLNMCGCKAQCGAEVARLASLFLSYPDFWDAWREYAITENESSDFTVALGFMSAIMRNKSLSIVHVLEAGLNALKTSSVPVFSEDTLKLAKDIEESGLGKTKSFSQVERCIQNIAKRQEEKSDSTAEDLTVSQETEIKTPDTAEIALDDVAESNDQVNSVQNNSDCEDFAENKAEGDCVETESDFDSLADVFPKSHIENYANFAEQQKVLQQKTKSTKETLAELIKDANITVEPIESSPFRTKSMADLLAEQGDYRGALDIYTELLKKGQGNKAELEERIADIKMLAPELDMEIDKSKLLAIDDLVDTSFGLMADTVSMPQVAVLSADSSEIPHHDEVVDNADAIDDSQENGQKTLDLFGSAEETEVTKTATEIVDHHDEQDSSSDLISANIDLDNLDIKQSSEKAEVLLSETKAEEPVLVFEENTDDSMQSEAEADIAVQEDKKAEVSANSDVADLLTKLAERLEIRAK